MHLQIITKNAPRIASVCLWVNIRFFFCLKTVTSRQPCKQCIAKSAQPKHFCLECTSMRDDLTYLLFCAHHNMFICIDIEMEITKPWPTKMTISHKSEDIITSSTYYVILSRFLHTYIESSKHHLRNNYTRLGSTVTIMCRNDELSSTMS